MIRTCVTCGTETILGNEIDGRLIVMDREPVTDGGAVLKGDVTDQPTVIWGVDTEADAEWFSLDFQSERYDRHECKRAAL